MHASGVTAEASSIGFEVVFNSASLILAGRALDKAKPGSLRDRRKEGFIA